MEPGCLSPLDEIHKTQMPELRELATTVQHTFREERDLTFVGAGLHEVLTFLRRAERHQLGPDDVARAIRWPLESGGRQDSM